MHLCLYILNSKNLLNAAVATMPTLRGCGERLKTSNETKASSFAQQRFLWCIGGSNSTWRTMVAAGQQNEATSTTGTVQNGRKSETSKTHKFATSKTLLPVMFNSDCNQHMCFLMQN